MKSNRLNHFFLSNLLGSKILMGLFVFSVLLAFTNSIKADVYPFNIRVTQPTSEAPFDGNFADGTAAAIRFFTPPSTSHFNATVQVVNSSNTVIKTITAADLSGTDNAVSWDGSLDNGSTAAPTGTYTINITTTMLTPATTYAQVFDFGANSVGLSTRGVTVVKDPLSKHLGYVYAVNGPGGAPWNLGGLTRVSMNGTFAGDSVGTQMVATTGEVIPSTTNRRYSPEAAEDGYIYIVGYNEKKILRFHPDSKDVQFFTADTIPTSGVVQDVHVVGTGASKKMYVATTTGVFVAEVGEATSYSGTYTKLLAAVTGITYWSVQLGNDNAMYIVTRTTTAATADTLMKFDMSGGLTLKTFADASWKVSLPDGDFVSVTLDKKDVATSADDIVYLSVDKAGAGTVKAGIYAVTDVTTTAPTITLVIEDPDNNISSTRTECAVDFGGNLMYYDNTSETILIYENPTVNPTHVVAGVNNFAITTSGIVTLPVSIEYAKADANNDFIPDHLNETLSVIGVVTSINFIASATGTSYYIQDETAGINIYKGGTVANYNIGDKLMLTGVIKHYRGLTELEISDLNSVQKLDSNITVNPTVVSIKQFLANPEYYEGRYIQINGAGLAPGSNAWPAANTNKSLTIWDGLHKLTMFIDKDTDCDDNPAPTFPINVKGVASQYSSGNTVYDDGYQIIPVAYAGITGGVTVSPSPYFSLLTPADSVEIDVISETETFPFTWNKAIDFNGDNLIYQFVVLPNLFATSPLPDTTYSLTAAKVLQLMGTNTEITFKWTVRTKESTGTNPIIACADTQVITFVNKTVNPESKLFLTHETGDLKVGIYNNGDIGCTVDYTDSTVSGPGATYKNQQGLYTGGLVFGTTAADTINGNVGSFLFEDLQNVSSFFADGFTTDPNFNQITSAILSDAKSTHPYKLKILSYSLSNTGEGVVYLRYGFINKSTAAINDFYAGVFIDWDIDNTGTNYNNNKGGYDFARHIVYQYCTTKPYYYGVVALNGMDGNKSIKSFAGEGATIRSDAFNYISSIDQVQPVDKGDYRSWIGTKLDNIAVGDTSWVTFAVIASDDLNGLATKAGSAFTKAKDLGWTDLVVGVEEENTVVIPQQFFVDQNYPNPFNPSTTISFGLPAASNVDLRIYNVLGQEVAVLINGQNMNAGTYNMNFNAANLSSGTYIYRLQAGSNVVTKKMMLIK